MEELARLQKKQALVAEHLHVLAAWGDAEMARERAMVSQQTPVQLAPPSDAAQAA